MNVINVSPTDDVQKISDGAAPGDALLFLPGTYTDKHVTAKPGLTYDGSDRAAVWHGGTFSGDLSGVTIRGFAFVNGPFAITSNSPNHTVISDNTFDGCVEPIHLLFFSGGGDTTIARNRIEGGRRIGIECQSNVQKDPKTGIGLVVEDNHIEGWGAGLDGQGDGHMGLSIATGKDPSHGDSEPTGIVVRRNVILGTGRIDAKNSTPIEIMGTAEVYGNYTAGGARGAAVIVGQSHGGVKIHDNTFLGCTKAWEGEPGFVATPTEVNNHIGDIGSVPYPDPVPFVPSPLLAGTGAALAAPSGFAVVPKPDGFRVSWDALPAGATGVLHYHARDNVNLNGTYTLPAGARTATVSDALIFAGNWIVSFALTYTLGGRTSAAATLDAQAPATISVPAGQPAVLSPSVDPILPPAPPTVKLTHIISVYSDGSIETLPVPGLVAMAV